MTNLPTPNPSLKDIGVSIIRTAVPAAWGAALTWVATQLPVLSDALNDPAATGFAGVLVATLTVLWYSLMRKLEAYLPAWLTVLVLGSNKMPTYDPTQIRSQGLRMPRTIDPR